MLQSCHFHIILTTTELVFLNHGNDLLAVGNGFAQFYYQGTDASSEGVQRDLLPLIEGD